MFRRFADGQVRDVGKIVRHFSSRNGQRLKKISANKCKGRLLEKHVFRSNNGGIGDIARFVVAFQAKNLHHPSNTSHSLDPMVALSPPQTVGVGCKKMNDQGP